MHPEAVTAREMVDGAFREIERLESVLSRHREGTPLARLNRDGVLAGAPAELRHVLARSLEYGELSNGAFDVTVAPLLALHAARFQEAGTAPAEAEVREALGRVDYRAVRIHGDDVQLELPGASLTLDGIAKGYVVDRAVQTLVEAGAGNVVVDAGGDMAAGGVPGSEDPWRVGVQDPRSAAVLGVLELRGECVASSGDYMQAYTRDLRNHHLVDPRTGRSPDHTSGVTVVAPTAMDADALSTAAFVLGPVEGLALLERLDGVEGLIVTKDQRRLDTSGFSRYLS
jgi:thiamine biosynthesis lipoprotein